MFAFCIVPWYWHLQVDIFLTVLEFAIVIESNNVSVRNSSIKKDLIC